MWITDSKAIFSEVIFGSLPCLGKDHGRTEDMSEMYHFRDHGLHPHHPKVNFHVDLLVYMGSLAIFNAKVRSMKL